MSVTCIEHRMIQVSNLEVQLAEDKSKVVVTAAGSTGESIVEVSAAV